MRAKRALILGVCIAALLSGCGPETPPPDSLAQTGTTLTPEVASPTPEPTVVSPLPTPTPSPEPTAVVPLPTATPLPEPTEIYTDIISIPPTPTPIPTPDVHATTVPELDNIAFVNPRPLQLPGEVADRFKRDLLGLLVWSPDSQRFVGVLHSGTLSTGNLERPLLDLFVGDPATGELALWQHNAGWPSWSRDSRFIYYVTLHSDGQNFHYDLYRRSVNSQQPELIIENVGIPYLPQSAAMETTNGEFLVFSPERQPALLRFVGRGPRLVPVASLPGLQEIVGQRGYFSLAPDGHTSAILSGGNLYVVNLLIGNVRAIDVSQSHHRISIVWSADSRYLAYAGSHGVFIYDRQTDRVRGVVTRQEMGFPEGDSRGGFRVISWSPDERVLLFNASIPDWADKGAVVGFVFAATQDGNYRKALSSQYEFDSIAPDRSRAVVTDWSNWPNPEQHLIDIVWR